MIGGLFLRMRWRISYRNRVWKRQIGGSDGCNNIKKDKRKQQLEQGLRVLCLRDLLDLGAAQWKEEELDPGTTPEAHMKPH